MDWGANYEKGRQVFGFGSLLAPVALALFIVSVQSWFFQAADCCSPLQLCASEQVGTTGVELLCLSGLDMVFPMWSFQKQQCLFLCGNSTAPCQCLQLDAYLNPHTRQHQRVRLLVFVSSPHNDESTRAKTTGLVCINVAFVSAVSLLDADLRMC